MVGATAPQPSKKRKRAEGVQDGIVRTSKKGKTRVRGSGGKAPDLQLSRNRETNSSQRHATARTPNKSDSEFASDCDPPLGIIREGRPKKTPVASKTGNKSVQHRLHKVVKSPVIHLGAIELTDDDDIQSMPIESKNKTKHPVINSSQTFEVIDLCSSDGKESSVEVCSINKGNEPAAFLTPVSSPVNSVHGTHAHTSSKPKRTTVNPFLDHAGPSSSPFKAATNILMVKKNDYTLDKATNSPSIPRITFKKRSTKSRKSDFPNVPVFGTSKPKAKRRHVQDMNGSSPTGLLTPLFFARAISDATSKFIISMKRAKKTGQKHLLAVETVETFHTENTTLLSASIPMKSTGKLKNEITNSRLFMDFLLAKKSRHFSGMICEALQLPQDTSCGRSSADAPCPPLSSTFVESIETKALVLPFSSELSQDDDSDDGISNLELAYPTEADSVY